MEAPPRNRRKQRLTILKILIFSLNFYHLYDVPLEYGAIGYIAAQSEGVDPYEQVGYLVSEHRGNYPTYKCGDGGKTCGMYSLSTLWTKKFGYDADDRLNWITTAFIAAKVIAYTKERHKRKCKKRKHNWRAHLKCSPSFRDNKECTRVVKKWLRIERKAKSGILLHSAPTKNIE